MFAQSARLPLFDRVELILADSGPGAGGLSSFGKEVHLLDQLLRKTRDEFFFVALDEFARSLPPSPLGPHPVVTLEHAAAGLLGGKDG